MGKFSNGESARASGLLRIPAVFERDGAAVTSSFVPISLTSPALRLTWLPVANDRGTQCWRHISDRRRWSRTCAPVPVDRIWMVSRRSLTRRRVRAFRRGALFACGGAHRALHPGAGRNIGQHGLVGILTSFANVPLPAVKRRPAQPPYGLRRQALPRIPCGNRRLSKRYAA